MSTALTKTLCDHPFSMRMVSLSPVVLLKTLGKRADFMAKFVHISGHLPCTWAAEFQDCCIRVNTLSPGVTDTPILDSQVMTPEERESLVNMYLSMLPIGREEVANAALFLASDQSSYMTGEDLMNDGSISQV